MFNAKQNLFALLFLSYFWVALPLNWLKSLQKLVNDASLKWLLQESKIPLCTRAFVCAAL